MVNIIRVAAFIVLMGASTAAGQRAELSPAIEGVPEERGSIYEKEGLFGERGVLEEGIFEESEYRGSYSDRLYANDWYYDTYEYRNDYGLGPSYER